MDLIDVVGDIFGVEDDEEDDDEECVVWWLGVGLFKVEFG